jgi:hypothetical protein
MKSTTINDKEYYYKLTISACKKFKEKCGVNAIAIDAKDVEQLQYLLFYGLEAGTTLKGEKFDLKIEVLDGFDIEELCQKLEDVKDDPKK